MTDNQSLAGEAGARFRLRMEGGEREGEEIPIPVDGLTVGRANGNGLVLVHSSVSSRHARLSMDGETLALRDLGSTNGTRVGGEVIEERRLAHGDSIAFGTIKARVIDGSMQESGAATEIDLEASGEAVHVVDAAAVGAASRRSPVALIALLLLAAVGAGLWFLRPWESGVAAAFAPVPEVPGNLLSDPSFEQEGSAWESSETAPESFYRSRAFAVGGTSGLGVDLAASDWAMSYSRSFTPRRRVIIAGALGAEGAAELRIGAEIQLNEDAGPPIIVWGPLVTESTEDGTVEFAFDVLPGTVAVRAVVAAACPAGDGAAWIDDVSAVLGPEVGPAASLFENELHLFSQPATGATLVRAGRVVISSIALESAAGNLPPGWPVGSLALAGGVEGGAMRLTINPAASAGEDVRLTMAVHVEGIATLGTGGFRPHASDFEEEGVTSLLAGERIDLLRVGFDDYVQLVARPGVGVLRVAATSPGGIDGVRLQVDFRAERGEAVVLGDRARDEEANGKPGQAIATWSKLLDRFPFDAALVKRAEETRARLVQAGFESNARLLADVERARFFQLEDLFTACLEGAQTLRRAYGGSEVEEEIAALELAITTDLQGFGSGGGTPERQRLEAVLSAIERDGNTALVKHLQSVLDGLDASTATGGEGSG